MFVRISGEFLFLSMGLRICYRAWKARTEDSEVPCITAIFIIEIVVSTVYYIVR